MSLLELLAALTIVGLLAAISLPFLLGSSTTAKRNACYVNKGEIELQAKLWFRQKGAWPAADLNDIGSDSNYFPAGLPQCPVDGTSYSWDATTGRVNGHVH